jgi:uncharacterized protein (DUF885 family)
MKRRDLLFFGVLGWAVTASTNAATEPRDVEQPVQEQRLYELFDEIWKWQMISYPEFATHVGYPGQDDRWTDLSAAAIGRRRAEQEQFLRALETIEASELRSKARLEYELIRKKFSREIEGFQFPSEFLQINQLGGAQQSVPRLLAMMPAGSVEDYENRLARLRAVPLLLEQTMALLDRGLAAGITPPRITLHEVPQQVRNLLTEDPFDSPLLRSFVEFPDDVTAESSERIRQDAARILRTEVYPAYQSLLDYLEGSYLPRTREGIARSSLPDGESWYAYEVRTHTTTELPPQRIHEIGLAEVKRIRADMEQVIRDIGFKGEFSEFTEFLRTDARFYFDDPEDLLSAYRDICKRADPELIRLFGTLPRLPYGVKQVPAYAEKSQTTAYYQSGSATAGRPGYFYANTYDLGSRPKWEMEALSLHEAVPGHHLQIALARELEETHDLLKYNSYTAYVEGWGLYAESLGEEMGFYRDPYAKFGQLTYEMWRAVRLVVDTGMHSLGWSRQRAIELFTENTGKTAHDIAVEVDRYIVWPGQALAYKIGELKIKELRAFAREQLGSDFDIRTFHDEVLLGGALPLDILEQRIKRWVERAKRPAE